MGRKLLLGLALLAPLGFYPLLHESKDHYSRGDYPVDRSQSKLTPDEQLAFACFSIFPSQSFPAALPWYPMGKLALQETAVLEQMAKEDPLKFLQHAMNRYKKEVHGYRCIFNKQEKVNKELKPKETILVHFREQPFSVHMEWLKGTGRAYRALYVQGKYDDLLNVRLSKLTPFALPKKVTAGDVMATSRFPITSFGMYLGAKSTVDHMAAAQAANTMHVEYLGLNRVEEVGNRWCFKFVRSRYATEEGLKDENLQELTIYIDSETLLQVGSILKDGNGNLIAEYFFRDIELNPNFDSKIFNKEAL